MLILNRIRSMFVAGLTLIVLLINAVFATPALADGGAPASPSGTTAATTAVSSSLPAGTNVVVLDHQGHKVPLGSQKAAEIMGASDPVWCPASVAVPTPGSGGCSPAIYNTDLYTLITNIALHNFTPPAANSTIWIEGGSMSGNGVWLNGDSGQPFSPWANYTLTIKGGWNGCTPTCTGTVNALNPSSGDVYLWITNWNNNIAISNLDISGADNPGLNISTTKNISLTNVKSNNNTSVSDGVTLDTTVNGGVGSISITNGQFNGNSNSGAHITAGTGGAVTISNAQFNGNAGNGLYITASGAVTLTNVTAGSNINGIGAYIINSGNTAAVTINGASNDFSANYQTNLAIQSKGAVTLANVTANGSTNGYGAQIDNKASSNNAVVNLSGINTFNNNYYGGLVVSSKGAITVNDLTASGNGVSVNGIGADLENNLNGSMGGVTLSGVNIFNGNGHDGLIVKSYGAIKASNLIVLGNGYDGVYLDNCNYGGITCNTPATQSVTLTGSSQFENNAGNGLSVVSNGLIIANNITAFSNLGSFGASFNNSYSGVKAGITLTGANVFNSNKYNGLSVYSNGTIQLSNITANSNDTAGQPLFYGADVRNATGAPTSNVVLTGINVFNDNYYDGLFINSAGAVTASSITANHQQWGAGITAAGAVTLTGSNTFNSNQVDGLDVFSSGAITTNNLTANENGQNGVYLDNCRSSSGCTVSSAQPVTLNGFNAFNSNVREGLVIYSKGAVKTNNLTADCNGFNAGCGSTGSFGYGVWIDNCRIYSGSCTGNGAVTVAGTNVFNGNYTGGLYIQSRGAITLNSITASFNAQGFGLNADNTFSGPGSPQTITLSGVSVFDGNNTWGAALSGYGKITASNVTARWNGLTGSTPGVSLNNYNGDSTTRPPAAIALSGVNSFIGNYGDGLDISATGAINVSNAASTGSVNGYGAVLTNNYFPGPQSVTMTALTASNNYYGGLLVSSHGAISGLNLTASGNDTSHSLSSYGADFSTDGSSLTLTGANVFNNNYWTNFHASALGAVTISNLQASGSVAGQGANISNGNASTASALSLTGSSVFWNNYLDGLYVFNFGPITANNLTASGNGAGGAHGVGAYLWNASASAPQKVTVTGVNTFNNNYYGGLAVSSLGPVAVSNVTASSNTHGSGVNITNSFSAAYGGVTLSGTNVANDNASRYGFEIYSAGAITLNNVTANGNTDGALLENDNYGSAGIAITGMNSFNNNSMNGMETYTKGSITLSQSAFDENTGTGLFVHNGSFNAFTVTMLCGSFTGNASGLALSSPATPITAIYLTGVVFSGNTTTNTLIGTTPLTQVRNCPLP